jgi:hypothetical protein
MNANQQRQLPNHTNTVQDNISNIIMDSQKHLILLKRSINASKAFNKRALEYLIHSAKLTSLDVSTSVIRFEDIIGLAPEETPEK